MAVETEEQFRKWLEGQPRDVCLAIAFRAAMRVLPLVGQTSSSLPVNMLSRVALMSLRACLITSVAAKSRIVDDLILRAARSAADAGRTVRNQARQSRLFGSIDAAARAAGAAVSAASDSGHGGYLSDTVSATLSAAGAHDAGHDAAIADTNISLDRLIGSPIPMTGTVSEALGRGGGLRSNILRSEGPWTFWGNWYDRAIAGDPLPWELQERIALIPNDIWEAGPEAVAAEIERIEDAYWAKNLPQAEELVIAEDGRFDVRPVSTPVADQMDKMLAQVQFALDLALQTNCGFNPMCVAYKYLRHTFDDCRDDANAIEQHFRQARDILKRKIAEGAYDRDDTLLALIDGLDQHALQLRGSHEEVRAAYEIRVQQKLRETDDATMRLVAGGMRAFQAERTTGRLYQDTGLDAETVEQDSGVEAKATAIQRTGGRVARANLIERASQAAKDVDASGWYKVTQMTTTGWTFVEMLKKIFGG